MAALVLDDAIAIFSEHIQLYRAKNITHREKVFEFEIFKRCDAFFGLQLHMMYYLVINYYLVVELVRSWVHCSDFWQYFYHARLKILDFLFYHYSATKEK